MADNAINNPEFDSFEVLLASLAPGGTNINRDRLMFEAGRNSMTPTTTKKRNSLAVWRTMSVLSTCAAIILAVLLVNRPIDQPDQIVEKVTTPLEVSKPLVEKKNDPIPQSYVQSERLEQRNGFSTWVLAFFDILPEENELPNELHKSRIDKLLEEPAYVSRAVDEDSDSFYPSQPRKTSYELMREFRQQSDNTFELFGERR